MSEYCDGCRFYRGSHKTANWGICKRLPPVIIEKIIQVDYDIKGDRHVELRSQMDASRQPLVHVSDWCGEFQARARG